MVSAFRGKKESTSGQVKTERLTPGDHHVCDMMVPLLPLPMELIRTKEIDTMSDYEHAVAWVKSGYAD